MSKTDDTRRIRLLVLSFAVVGVVAGTVAVLTVADLQRRGTHAPVGGGMSEQAPRMPDAAHVAPLTGERRGLSQEQVGEEALVLAATSTTESWLNPNRDQVRITHPQLPGIMYHRGLLPNRPFNQAYHEVLEPSTIFNPQHVPLSDDQRRELDTTLGRLIAERDSSAVRLSEVRQAAVEERKRAGSYDDLYERPFPSYQHLYEKYKKYSPNIEWAIHYHRGKLGVILLSPEAHPSVFEARRQLAAAFDRATEYVFCFFESITQHAPK